eukprot:s2495_g12.t1
MPQPIAASWIVDVEVALQARLAALEVPPGAGLEAINTLIQICFFLQLLHVDNRVFAKLLGKCMACLERIQVLWLAAQPIEDATYRMKFDPDAMLSPLAKKLEGFETDLLAEKLQQLRRVVDFLEPILESNKTNGVQLTLRSLHALASDVLPHVGLAVSIRV